MNTPDLRYRRMGSIGCATLALVVALGGHLAAAPAPAPKTPNIVIILADDYGYGSLGCYGADPKLIRTPGLDRLAKEGRRFTDANTTSSVCSPTRYSLLTGRYCWRTSLTHEVLGTFSPLHIEPGRLNVASLLKSHGYRTAAIGKWHLGYGTGDGTPRWRTNYVAELKPGPQEIGFDYHFGVPSNHGDLTGIYVENHFVYGLRSGGNIPEAMKLPGPDRDDPDFKPTYTSKDTEADRNEPMAIDAPRRVNERVMPLLTRKAVEWIGRQKAGGEPFFLYFTPVAVHNPVTPSAQLAGKSGAGPYGDWIHELDRSVEQILEALDRANLAKDTLVLFTSDNGGVRPLAANPNRKMHQWDAIQAGLKVNGDLRGGKHSVWQGGFQVPFIVRWPEKVPAGTVCRETVSVADILATMSALVGDKLPAAGKGAEDSYNILPAILGQALEQPIRADLIVHSADGVFAIRKGPWKWIEGLPVDEIKPGVRKARAEEFSPQLYNLEKDPAETSNVIAAHPQIAKELSALLERYRAGGYSRELPPLPEPRAKVAMPEALKGIVVSDALENVPGAPWVQVRGKWLAKDKAIWGTQAGADPGPAALRSPLSITDGDICYEVFLPVAGSHALRIQGKERTEVFHIEIAPRKLAIVRQPAFAGDALRTLAREDVKLKPGAWTPVRVSFRGREIFVQAGEADIKGTYETLAQPKTAFAFLVFGENIGFTRLSVAK